MPGPVVAIHQPNFLPWAGYFRKMAVCDTFIYLDTAPFTRNGLQNRNRILTAQGLRWLTVPVRIRGFRNAETRRIEINSQTDWRRKHLKTLEICYGRAPHFDRTYPGIAAVYGRPAGLLADFNLQLLELCREFLNIGTPVVRASELPETGRATRRLISLVQSVQGRTYVSGSGGRNYLDESLFREAGIALVWLDWEPRRYPQTQPGFVPGLSIIDALFALGPDVGNMIREGGHRDDG